MVHDGVKLRALEGGIETGVTGAVVFCLLQEADGAAEVGLLHADLA